MTRDEFIEAVKGYLAEEEELSKKWGVERNVTGYDYDDEIHERCAPRDNMYWISYYHAQFEEWKSVYPRD